MKWACRKSRRLSVLNGFGELTETERSWLVSHRKKCQLCSAFQADVDATLRTVARVPNFARDDAKSPDIWPRIAAALTDLSDRATIRPPYFLQNVPPVRKYGFAAALAVVLVCGGIIIGRYFVPAPEAVKTSGNGITSTDREFVDQIRKTREYLDRARTLLIGIVNSQPGLSGSVSLDLQKEQEVSRELASEGRDIRVLLRGDDQELQRLLIDELEVLLKQLSELEQGHARSGVEAVRREVVQRGILLKINIEDMKMVDRLRKASSPHLF